jgi:hypothetical protein
MVRSQFFHVFVQYIGSVTIKERAIFHARGTKNKKIPGMAESRKLKKTACCRQTIPLRIGLLYHPVRINSLSFVA